MLRSLRGDDADPRPRAPRGKKTLRAAYDASLRVAPRGRPWGRSGQRGHPHETTALCAGVSPIAPAGGFAATTLQMCERTAAMPNAYSRGFGRRRIAETPWENTAKVACELHLAQCRLTWQPVTQARARACLSVRARRPGSITIVQRSRAVAHSGRPPRVVHGPSFPPAARATPAPRGSGGRPGSLPTPHARSTHGPAAVARPRARVWRHAIAALP